MTDVVGGEILVSDCTDEEVSDEVLVNRAPLSEEEEAELVQERERLCR